MATGIVVLAPQAQAAPSRQCKAINVEGDLQCLDKTVSTNQATKGESVIFTVELSLSPGTPGLAINQEIVDILPPDVELVSATPSQGSCGEFEEDKITCGPFNISSEIPGTVTVEAIPTKCGAFTNTATNPNRTLTVEAPFTVQGCQGQDKDKKKDKKEDKRKHHKKHHKKHKGGGGGIGGGIGQSSNQG